MPHNANGKIDKKMLQKFMGTRCKNENNNLYYPLLEQNMYIVEEESIV
ncbi:MAG: hypothetical protein ACLRXQ_06515 [Phascolarctobacterium faecium]